MGSVKIALVVISAVYIDLLAATGVGVQQPPLNVLRRQRPELPELQVVLTQKTQVDAGPSWVAHHKAVVRDVQPVAVGPKSYTVTKLRAVKHEGKPWTQGLEFSNDKLVETSGDWPSGTGSAVRVVDPETGNIDRKITKGLGHPTFLEGITKRGDSWFAITYEDHKLFEFNENFDLQKESEFPWQGWGLSLGSEGLYVTNSTEYLMTLDANTLETKSVKTVKCFGQSVAGLNELEAVPDFFGQGPVLMGNIINTRLVLVLDPNTAECTGVFHLEGAEMEPVQPDEQSGFHVANGIAYDSKANTYWVTGKNWENMFQISLSQDEHSGEAVQMLSNHLNHLGA